MRESEWIADKLDKLISDVEAGKIKDEKYIKESLAWFRHERLVHLLVTMFVWLFFAILFIVKSESIFVMVLDCVLLILEFFYLVHYYKLENWVQKLNQLYLKLISKK